jgi:hypothetical protein
MPQIVNWYDQHLKAGPLETREVRPTEEVLYLQRPAD